MGCASSIVAAAIAPPRAPPLSLAEAAAKQRRASLNNADLHHQHSSLLLSADGGQWRDRWREAAKASSLKGSLKGSSRSFEGSIKGSSRSFETADPRRGSFGVGNAREGSPLAGSQASGTDSSRMLMPQPNVDCVHIIEPTPSVNGEGVRAFVQASHVFACSPAT